MPKNSVPTTTPASALSVGDVVVSNYTGGTYRITTEPKAGRNGYSFRAAQTAGDQRQEAGYYVPSLNGRKLAAGDRVVDPRDGRTGIVTSVGRNGLVAFQEAGVYGRHCCAGEWLRLSAEVTA